LVAAALLLLLLLLMELLNCLLTNTHFLLALLLLLLLVQLLGGDKGCHLRQKSPCPEGPGKRFEYSAARTPVHAALQIKM
jgi:hypothetical protein